ncbi:hypothetical protein BGX28_003158 [Mortierella sp. GBA30]|nr:hypothetical protein BGX28_003158 [Mortierella sp. GBA30]
MKKSHISLARVTLLVCTTFMIMGLAHIHYTNVYRQAHAGSDNNNQVPHDNNEAYPHFSNPPNPLTGTPPSVPHVPTVPPTPSPPSNSQPPSTPSTESIISKTETSLTTTIRFRNGTLSKDFKPAFYKDPKAARREMGSFLETLATRSWWVQNKSLADVAAGNNGDAAEGEEEQDDHRDEEVQRQVKVSNTFFTYLPMGGGNNQFTSLQKAALLAKDLNRTLIIPPISPNSHIKVWAGPRYSEFYDLEHFSSESGISILEWHDVKQTPDNPSDALSRHWNEFSEEFPCIANGGIGVNDKNLYDHFRPQFLMNFKAVTPVEDKTAGKSTEYAYARDVLLRDTKSEDGKPDMYKCLSCPYFLGAPELGERSWTEVGLHMRFNDKINTMVDDILDILLPRKTNNDVDENGSDGRRHPEFIIVHLRRGDIVTKCAPGQAEKDCLVQIEEIAEKVDEIEKQRRIQALKETNDKNAEVTLERLPVLVTTNEKRKEELDKLEKLGWIMLDHGDEELDDQGHVKPSANIKLGTMTRLGPFYPPMLDAVLLTRGDYFIGMKNSRMSQLAAQRGANWHGHHTMLM